MVLICVTYFIDRLNFLSKRENSGYVKQARLKNFATSYLLIFDQLGDKIWFFLKAFIEKFYDTIFIKNLKYSIFVVHPLLVRTLGVS